MVPGRLDLLESNMRSNDQEIRNIHQELADLRQQCQRDSAISVEHDSGYRNDWGEPAAGETSRVIRVEGVTVEQVQRALKKAGFYDGDIDGKLGPKTRRAIKEFQRANQIAVDGVVGKGTWGRLKNSL